MKLRFIKELRKNRLAEKVRVYPEIKAPWFHHQNGKDIAAETLKVLKKYGYDKKTDMVYLQAFDFNELKRIKTSTSTNGYGLKLVQLIIYRLERNTKKKTRVIG